MADLAKYVVALEAQTAKYKRGLDAANRKLGAFHKRQNKLADGISSSFLKMATRVGSALGGIALGSQLVQTSRETAVLETQLETMTGSADKASQAFEILEGFAARTPFALDQSVTAFTRLTARGLTPSERALTSYGDTASAMGKSLIQFIEAVADASVAGFVRLEEFGIKAKNEGETVAFTFKGVTTSVENDAASIEEFLIKLGETEFAGGMARQAKTIDGAISNLGDSWDGLLRSVSRAGVGDAMTEEIVDVSTAFDKLSLALDQYEDNVESATDDTGIFAKSLLVSAAFAALMTDGVTRLGTRLGALAAGIVTEFKALTSTGDFGGSFAINEAFKADMKELDEQMVRVVAALEGIDLGLGSKDQPALESLVDDTSKKEAEAKRKARLAEEQKLANELIGLTEMTTTENVAAWDRYVFARAEQNAELQEDFEKKTQQQKEVFTDLLVDNMIQAADAGFDSILKSWAKMLQQMIAKALASKLFDLLAGIGGGGKGSLGGAIAGFFGGGKASGGRVNANQGFIVGENGPEFLAGVSGSIVPNHELGGTSNVFNIDARGADANVVPLIEAGVQRAVAIAEKQRIDSKVRGRP